MKKNTTLSLLLFGFLLILLLYPNLCLQSAQQGLLLWFNKVLPSLLPFMILINILIPLDGLKKFATLSTSLSKRIWHLPGYSFLAFIMGLLAGYPMGAKVVKQLYEEQKLTQQEAETTLCFCNNCGPLFIIGTIGTAMLSNTSLGYFLLLIHLLSACIMSLLTTRTNTPSCTRLLPSHKNITPPTFASLLNKGVMNAMDTIVCVGGYIILFSVITALLTQSPLALSCSKLFLPSASSQAIFTGCIASILELSNGAYHLSQLPLSILSLAAISATIGFGGFCVYFQTLYVLEGCNLSTSHYLAAKGLQGLLSFALTLLLYPIYVLYTQGTKLHSGYLALGCSFLLLTGLLSFLIFNHHPSSKVFHVNKPT